MVNYTNLSVSNASRVTSHEPAAQVYFYKSPQSYLGLLAVVSLSPFFIWLYVSSFSDRKTTMQKKKNTYGDGEQENASLPVPLFPAPANCPR